MLLPISEKEALGAGPPDVPLRLVRFLVAKRE
jgi:hypothetical protein